MGPGPILWRELLVTSRTRGTYVDRSVAAAMVLGVIVACAVVNDWTGQDRTSLAGLTRFTMLTFGLVVGILTAMMLGMVPAGVAPGVAGERDRKTLDALLATQLSAAEVVLGSFAAGLIKQMVGLAAGFSVVILMIPFAGIDPRLVLLAFSAITATAYAAGAVSVAISVHAKSARKAVGASMFLIWFVWFTLPVLLVLLLPKIWPRVGAWVFPFAVRLLDTNPMGVFLVQFGPFQRPRLVGAVARMITFEVLGGSLLVAFAVWRLRPASRAVYDDEGRSLLRALKRTRWRSRPPCGDDPVLWNEMYDTRGVARWQWLLGAAINLGLVVLFTWLTYRFASPAFLEVIAFGYTAAPGEPHLVDINPVARAIVRSLGSGPGLEDVELGMARHEFNALMRMVTGLGFAFYILILAGFASEAVTNEREKDTWLALIATPLTGREILRGKMLGGVWRLRGLIGGMLLLWIIGFITGAVHPLGLLLSLAGLGVSGWLMLTIGVYVSLWSKDRKEATGRVIFPSLLLAMGGIVFAFVPASSATIYMAAGSPPLVSVVSLLSYEDVRTATLTGGFPSLAEMGIRTGEGAGRVATTVLISLTAQAVLAFLLTCAAVRGFDAAAGRTVPRTVHEVTPTLVVART